MTIDETFWAIVVGITSLKRNNTVSKFIIATNEGSLIWNDHHSTVMYKINCQYQALSAQQPNVRGSNDEWATAVP